MGLKKQDLMNVIALGATTTNTNTNTTAAATA
jgi:hypothetical protein